MNIKTIVVHLDAAAPCLARVDLAIPSPAMVRPRRLHRRTADVLAPYARSGRLEFSRFRPVPARRADTPRAIS